MQDLFAKRNWGLFVVLVLVFGRAGAANEVNLTEYLPYLDLTYHGEKIRIQRIQDTKHVLTGGFAKTSRPCPPFCIHPMEAAPGVRTVGELEIFDFMKKELMRGTGVIIDARTATWYKKKTIPGSINIPFTVFAEPDPNNPDLWAALEKLGVKRKGDTGSSFADSLSAVLGFFGSAKQGQSEYFDFSRAKDLLLFCNGPWCDQSPRAIKGLRAIGYPAEKLYYYRGGMQVWLVLGLTTVPGK